MKDRIVLVLCYCVGIIAAVIIIKSGNLISFINDTLNQPPVIGQLINTFI